MKKTILVSACLLGRACRYDGKHQFDEKVDRLKEDYHIISVCPEQLGGLSTPRQPSEIKNKRVIFKDGTDVTNKFYKGAHQVIELIKDQKIEFAVLKEYSPSCGTHEIYDGSFTGQKKPGMGITAQVLKEHGIKVISEEKL